MMEGTTTTTRLSMIDAVIEKLDAHASCLESHLKLVQNINSNQATAVSRTSLEVSQIVESAQNLIEQFAALRKELGSFDIGAASAHATATATASTTTKREKLKPKKPQPTKKLANGDKTGKNSVTATKIENSSEVVPNGGRKRSRESDSLSDSQETQQSSDQSPSDPDLSLRKRARTKRKISGAHEMVEDYVPVALQKDDISEEVERRLKLKEDKRKKRIVDADASTRANAGINNSNVKAEKKRKRDSTASSSSRNGRSSSRSASRSKRARDSQEG